MKTQLFSILILSVWLVYPSLAQNNPSVSGSQQICSGETTTLTASGATGANFDWYEVASGGTPIANTAAFTTPTLDSTTHYYVSQTVGAYTSPRTWVGVYVTNIPSPDQPFNVSASPSAICMGESSSLVAAVDATNDQIVNWYDAPNDGNLIASTDSGVVFTVQPNTTKTYYAQSESRTVTLTFDYTGSVQYFTIPDNVFSLEVEAYGAQGGANIGVSPAGGGQVNTTLSVEPGEQLGIYVGGQGEGYYYNNPNNYCRGGWNGGAFSQSSYAGGGGGATDIRIGGNAYTTRVLVAGASGGHGSTTSCPSGVYYQGDGGAGGGLTGNIGGYCWLQGNNPRGKGGTQTAGGAGGTTTTSSRNGYDGSLGQGGQGGLLIAGNNGGGGGGGAGYYGGGGGAYNAGGGGGSSWTDPERCTNTSHAQGVRSGNGQLIIRYKATADCASSTRTPVTVTVNPLPNLQVSNDSLICLGDTIELQVSGADTYLWPHSSESNDTVQVAPNSPTTYTVQGTSSSTGCSNTADINITIQSLPNISLTPDTFVNQGASITLYAGGTNLYTWSPGGSTDTTITVSPSAHTNYILTGRDTLTTCSKDTSVWVSVIEALSISGLTRICGGHTTTLSASASANATIHWYDAASGGNLLHSGTSFTSPILTSNTTIYVEQSIGTYTSNRQSISIIVTPSPSTLVPINLQVNPTTICAGDSAQLSAEVDHSRGQKVYWYDALEGGNLVHVSDSGEVLSIAPTSNTTYYAQSQAEIFQDTFECTKSVQQFIVPADVYTIQVNAFGASGGNGVDGPGGLGGQVEATLAVTPGDTLYLYVGEKGEGHLNPNTYGSNSGGWNGGGFAYNFTAGGGGGATDIRKGGTLWSDRILVVGGGGGARDSCTADGPVGGDGGGLIGAAGGVCDGYPSTRGGQGGTQSAGGARGCWDGTSHCGVNGSLARGGSGYSYYPNYGGGGGGGYYGGGGGTVRCDGGGGSSYTDPDLCTHVVHQQGVRDGNGLLIFEYIKGENCADSTRIPITLTVAPQAHLVTIDSLTTCPGVAVELTASGADQYNWSPGNLSSDTVQINPSTSTSYTLVGSMNGPACTDTATIYVAVETVEASTSMDSICSGHTIELTASGAESYLWTPGNLPGSTQTISPTNSSTYIVEGINPGLCSSFDTLEITVIPNTFELTILGDTAVLSHTAIPLSVMGIDSATWSDGSTGLSIHPLITKDTLFTATGVDPRGCIDSDTIHIVTKDMPDVSGPTILLSGNSTTLTATTPSRSASYTWYDAPTDGNILATTASYTTPLLDSSAVYFVEMDDGSGPSLRKCIKVNIINPERATLSATQDTICESSSTHITGTLETPGEIRWYDSASGGFPFATTDSGDSTIVSPTSTRTYYAQGQTSQEYVFFNYTGSMQTFTVPDGVTNIEVYAYGGEGGRSYYQFGGRGGIVQANLNVTPGEVLNIFVGGAGSSSRTSIAFRISASIITPCLGVIAGIG
ncbi:MAG: glycine-rich protein [Bacteroidota bacterium]